MYRVVHFFTDLQDNEHPYNVGDTFPRRGKRVSDERLAELSGTGNRQKVRLIEEVKRGRKNVKRDVSGTEKLV